MSAPDIFGSSSFMPYLYFREYYDNLTHLDKRENIQVTGFNDKKNLVKFVKEVISAGLNTDASYIYKINDKDLIYCVERID